MKSHTLPVKRRPVPKGIFKRLSAFTGNRKQQVTAVATPDMEYEDGSSKIARALTIIFLTHIVAIGLYFVHQRFLDGRAPEATPVAKVATADSGATAATVPVRRDLPRMASGEKPYIVRQGDNYARIAAAVGVQENDLRLINQHVDIVPGLLLKIPPKSTVPVVLDEPALARQPLPVDDANGLVAAVDANDEPQAVVVKPTYSDIEQAPAATTLAVTKGKSYVVQKGDSIWRIANRLKISQETLMKANGITKNQKIQPGMNLVIPR